MSSNPRKRTYSGSAARPSAARRRRTTAAPVARARLPYAQALTRGPGRQMGLTEVKSFDCPVLGGALPSIATPPASAEPGAAFVGITEINCIQQGATVANRIGNKIVIKSLHVKGSLVNAVPANVGVARLMLVYDTQTNGAFPAITDILLEQPLGAAMFYGGVNIANKSRFQIIRDKFYNLDSAQSQIHTFNLYCKGRWEVEYGANAGTIGDFRTGAIYLVGLFSNSAINLSATNCRSRYFD